MEEKTRRSACKRRLSPSANPSHSSLEVVSQGLQDVDAVVRHSSKRRRTHISAPIERQLSEELVLRVLSFLDAPDLVTVSTLSRRWQRLADDSQLWKGLFYRHFASSCVRNTSQRFLTSSSSRFIDNHDGEHTWKAMYRISANWRSGRAKSATVRLRKAILDPRVPVEMTDAVGEEAMAGMAIGGSANGRTDTIVQFCGSLIFTASRSPSPGSAPSVQVHQTIATGSEFLGSVVPRATQGLVGATITEMRVDEARPPKGLVRLAVFYSTGQLGIFRITSSSPSIAIHEQYLSSTSSSSSSTSGSLVSEAVAIARFHFPLLVTCSTDFTLAFYILRPRSSPSGDERLDISRAQPGMRSQMCWWPLVVSLSRLPSSPSLDVEAEEVEGMRFKATVAYSTPFYPSAWTIAVQEFTLHIPTSSSDVATVLTRHATALPTGFSRYLPSFSSRRARHRFFASREEIEDEAGEGRLPNSLVTGLEHSAPYVVVSRADNTLDVFEIVDDNAKEGSLGGGLRVVHRRTLFGHAGSVGAVAVEGGRCVSGGEDGVKVWELDRERECQEDWLRSEVGQGWNGCEEAVSVWTARGEEARGRSATPEPVDEGRSFLALATPSPPRPLAPRSFPPAPSASSSSPSKPTSRARGESSKERRRPSIRWVGFDREKIVQVGKDARSESATGEETVRVLSFA